METQNTTKREKLQLKLADILMSADGQPPQFLTAFEQLASLPLSEQYAWPVVESYEQIQAAVNTFTETRNKLVKELGVESPEGNGQFSIPPEKSDAFFQRINALLEGTVEISLSSPVVLPERVGGQLTPKQRLILVRANVLQKPATAA